MIYLSDLKKEEKKKIAPLAVEASGALKAERRGGTREHGLCGENVTS